MEAQYQAEHIADALGGKRVGNGWKARCPAHDDRTPSLQITVKDGKVLVHCFAGCDQQSVLEVLRDRGLWPDKDESPIPPPRRQTKAAPPPTTRPSARFVYRAIDGTPLAMKERTDYIDEKGQPAKTCTWLTPDGRKGLGGVKPILYRLEKLPATPVDTPILFVEGEKCVRAAESVGAVAVSGPHGSESKLDSDTANLFRGRTVILCPDHDAPGQKLMKRIEKGLRDAGAAVFWLELPGLGEHEDIADWVERGGAAEDLARLVEDTLDRNTPKPVLVLLRDVQRESLSFLWHPYLPLKKLTIVDGDPGAKKSWFTGAIAAAVSRGWGLPGDDRHGIGPQPVLILAGEDGLEETVRPRLEDMGADLDLITAMVAVIKEEREHVLMFDPDGLEALRRAVERLRPALVVIDPLVAYLGGSMDMGRANEVRALLRPLADMAQRYGCAIAATRHLTKALAGSALYRGQGSIDFNATARSVIGIAVDPQNEEQSIAAHIKASLTRKGPSLVFGLSPMANGGTALSWGGTSNLTAEELFGPGEREDLTSLDEAKNFLQELLFDGPVPSREVSAAAKDIGIAERTLRRAKDDLGIIWKRRVGSRGRTGEVVLEMPLIPDEPKNILPFKGVEKLGQDCQPVLDGQVFEEAETGESKPNSNGTVVSPSENLANPSRGQVFENPTPEPLTSDPANPDVEEF